MMVAASFLSDQQSQEVETLSRDEDEGQEDDENDDPVELLARGVHAIIAPEASLLQEEENPKKKQ